MKFFFKIILYIILVILLIILCLSFRKDPDRVTYGVSFNISHSNELGLDWKETYNAILGDLGVKHLRLSAQWDLVELGNSNYHFDDLDYQMYEAKQHGADVILAIGRKTPGWPECHEPLWDQNLATSTRQENVLAYVQATVERYKTYSNIKFWQIENEPFLQFATTQCGGVDATFVSQEVALVRKIDPTHPVLVTDGGEFGTWYNAWKAGDVFGTSEYLYIWQHFFGPMRYPIGPTFFKVKLNLAEMLLGKKPSILIELGAEPWLLTPIASTSIDAQLQRMSLSKFNEIIDFAKQTSLSEQYLWGAEWWYWMKQHGHPEFWNQTKQLYEAI